jgi:hypothetical protein
MVSLSFATLLIDGKVALVQQVVLIAYYERKSICFEIGCKILVLVRRSEVIQGAGMVAGPCMMEIFRL